MKPTDEHKQGATFSRTGTVREEDGTPVDLTGVVLASRLRDVQGNLIDTFVCTLLPQTGLTLGQYTIERAYAQTAAWPLTTLQYDVEYTFPDGTRDKTETVELTILESM